MSQNFTKQAHALCVALTSARSTAGFHAGPEEELQPLLEALKAEGVFVRELSTCGVAYHSPLLDPLLPQLTAGVCAAVRELMH